MKEEAAVVNNVSIGENAKLHLVTGSNMSGKSTFLRTLGLNLVLAQVGAPVFAKVAQEVLVRRAPCAPARTDLA